MLRVSRAGSWSSLLGRDAGLELAAALELGVDLGAEQQRQVGDPQPQQADDDAGQRAVGLVVAAEVGDVERERRPRPRSRSGSRRPPRPRASGTSAAARWGSRSRGSRRSASTTSTITGHFAMFQTVTRLVAEPDQRRRSTARAARRRPASPAPAHQQDRDQGDRAASAGAASRTGGPRRSRRSGSSPGRRRRRTPTPTTGRRAMPMTRPSPALCESAMLSSGGLDRVEGARSRPAAQHVEDVCRRCSAAWPTTPEERRSGRSRPGRSRARRSRSGRRRGRCTGRRRTPAIVLRSDVEPGPLLEVGR